MKTLRRHRFAINAVLTALVILWQVGQPLQGAAYYWDADGLAAGNDPNGTSLGGAGSWNGPTNWWDGAAGMGAWPNTNLDAAIFTGPVLAPFAPFQVTLGSGTIANRLSFLRSGYTLSGGDLTLAGTAPTLHANLGEIAVIDSLIQGTAGLVKTGGGGVRLGNAGNSYTGVTDISNGSLIISNAAQLGGDSSEILVRVNNPVAGSTALRGYGGGSLVLDGTAGGISLARNLSLQGYGPIGDRGAALLSVGNNTLSGTINAAVPTAGTVGINTRLTAADGTLHLSGNLNVNGTAGTTVTSLGGTNTAGASLYDLTGTLSGTGTLEKTGGGTLFHNPSLTANFNGVLRIGGSVTTGQSSVRISSAGVLGSRTATGTSGVLDMNGGVLEVRMDAPVVTVSNGTAANVYLRASSTLFVDKSIGGNAVNGTAVFGQAAFEDNITTTLASRNGYGMTFGTAPVVGSTAGDNDSTFTNNAAGLVTFTGNFWSNANNSANRTMTISGNGNTLIDGNVIASAASFDHGLTKTGDGLLKITGTGSTLDGTVSVNGGGLAITDFRSVTNNTARINIGSSGTSGALLIGTGQAATAAGLTTDKVINLAGTTGGASIYANQASANPVVINAPFLATGGSSSNAKTLTLGGTNAADNIIKGVIPNNAAGGSVAVTKIGSGTWVLAGTNTYTGTTTITEGVLKLQANAATSTVLPATNLVTFNSNNGFGGGTLEFVGQDGVNNVQNLGGKLSYGGGAHTIKVTPGAGGTASLTFNNLGTTGSATLNIVGADFTSNRVTFTQVNDVVGSNGILTRSVYWNGSHYAYREGGVLRAPVYGTDTGTATTATGPFVSGSNNEMTGSFATNSISIATLRIPGSQTLTINAGQTLTLSGAGVLATGGASTITGGAALATGSGILVARVNEAADTLTIESPITGSGGLTKAGAGTLVLAGVNTRTGPTSIDEGTVQLSGSGTLSGNNADTTIRQLGTLDLNGVSTGNAIGAMNNEGRIINSSANAVTLRVGGNNTSGTSFGIIDETNGVIHLTKVGTAAQSWLGTSTYTGVTTIESTGLVTVDTLADIGQPSGIGRGSVADNAGSLVFNGAGGGLVYAGSLRNGNLTLGATSASTNRLFTLAGSSATLSSTAANNNAIVWSNTGAIVHGTNENRTVILTGTSQGENTLNPQITDSTGFVTSLTKTGTGIWRLGNSNNTYSGTTLINQGILMATDGQGLSANSNLVFDGGTLYSQGTLNRAIGTGPGQMQFATPAANTAQFSGGFLGGDSKLTVTWTGTPVWGSTPGFLDTRDGLILNGSQARAQGATGSIALSEVDIAGDFSLGTAAGAGKTPTAMVTTNSSTTINGLDTSGLMVGQTISGLNIPSGAFITSINSATQVTINTNTNSSGGGTGAGVIEASTLRPIRVDDNGNTGADFATLSGVISGNAGTGIRKLGSGTLRLTGANTYDGETNVNQGTLAVTSLGNSSVAGASSVGTTVNANQNSNAVTLGNMGSGGAILQYVGVGETSDRKIRLNATTGSNQIHSDGVGPLVLTNVANDMAGGAKTLFLRGTNTLGNIITSPLSDNGGSLAVTIDGSATWILTSGANNYSGTTTSGAGALGIGHDAALGSSTLSLNSGSVFAYGADRTIANTVNFLNNVTQGFQGDYSLTFTAGMTNQAAGNTITLNNNITAGKALTFNGVTANSMTANRTWNIDGSGLTIISGNLTTSTVFGMPIAKLGDGTLALGGGSSNFNQSNANIDVDRGTLRIDVDNAIPALAGYGGLILSPEVATGDTATFDLNGRNQTINAFTATTDGVVIVDNTSATAASFTFGANNATVSFGSGIGSYTIRNSGGGPLSIFKAGNTSTVFSAGLNLQHTGTTGVTGGSFTIASPVNGTSGLSVSGNGSVLALTGGITNPAAVTSIVVDNGGTLSLLDGAGSHFSNLATLTLGAAGGSMTTLNLNVGDLATAGDNLTTDLLSLLNTGTLTLFSGNKVTLNLTDAGLNPGQTYDLLTFAPGGFTGGPLTAADWVLGATPGGFTSISLTADNDRIYLTTGSLVTGNLFWRGSTNTAWNGALNNWTTDPAGNTPGLTIPGQGTDVVFVSDPVSGVVATTLEQNFKINSLTFRASAATPSSVTINPGTVTTNRLEIAPQNAAAGIEISGGGPVAVNVNTAVKLGADQTWNVVDAGATLTIAGSLMGEANVAKSGAGKVTLTAAADPTFNSGATTAFTISGGTFEFTNAAALGAVANSNLATVTINGGTFYYNNGTSGTVPNNLTLGGGTLAAAGNGQTYSGTINLASDSTVSTRDAGVTVGTTRTVTLSGVMSGAGKLTVNGNTTLSAGNTISGTVVLSQANPLWSGGLLLQQGTVDLRQEASIGTGAVTANSGRFLFKGAQGTTWNQFANGLTINNPGANAVLELQPDNQGSVGVFTTDVTGTLNLGSATSPGFLRIYHADSLSALEISGPVVLGTHGSIHTSGSASNMQPVVIDGVISDGGNAFNLTLNGDSVWNSSSHQTIRLAAANTFGGTFGLNAGTAEFSTVSDIGGGASNLGQGSAITLGTGTLSFVGGTSQSTNRPIGTTGSATLSANGTSGAVITYTGAITQTTNNSLSLAGTGEGRITGGITQSGTSGDLNVNGGIWHLENATSVFSDDIVVSGPGTVLNLDMTGGMTFTSGTSNGLHARNGAVINLNANDVNGAANSGGLDFINVGDSTSGAAGVLNTNTFNITSPGLLIGAVAPDLEGNVIGSGTITVTNTATDWALGIRTYRGSIAASLAGVSSLLKQGMGTVTLSGNNSGLTGTVAATRLDAGTLILDYGTQNNAKISTSAQLDMRGATLVLNGNAGANTAQGVTSFTLANGGANIITLNSAGAFSTALSLGAITRAASAGTLRIHLPANGGVTTTTANGTHGLLGSSAFATVTDSTGTWFARNDGANNITALTAAAKNDVTTWSAGDHITDETTGFSGTLVSANLNSLRFNAAGGSRLNVAPAGVLNLASGGLLVTDNVAADSPGIYGGTLANGVTELIVTHDSSRVFEISSDIRLNNALTKTGDGTLLLSGNNPFTGQVLLQEGILQLSGGNAIGDSALVTLADDRVNTLELLSDETIGRLAGGSASTGLHTLATVAIGNHTLTINSTISNTTYAGLVTGTGTIVKQGTHQMQFTGSSAGFTGDVVVNNGLFYLSGTGRLDASSITVNKGGTFLIDNNGSTRTGARILDTTPIILNSADGTYQGQTIVRGLNLRSDQEDTNSETVGVITANSGANYMSLEATTSNDDPNLTATNVVRANSATLNIRGTNLGSANTQRAQFRIGDATLQTNFITALIGGAGAAASQNISIVPWAMGESYTGGAGDGFMGNSLVTYVSGSGFRTLDLTTEYDTFTSAAATENVRESLATNLTVLTGKTINALVLNNAATATVNVAGSGVGQALANTSGAFLFTVTGGANSTPYTTSLGGFDGGITVGGAEYIFHVVNPSSAANTATLTAAVGSPLTSVADITKSGRGTLILSGVNTAGGGVNKTTFNEGVLEISDLDNIGGNTGGLVFAGGTLRLSGTYAGDDFSVRPITLLNGGATIDTNGNSPALANTIGSGSGGLTKVGTGTLTLNAAANYTGPTVVNGGTLAVGANNATGIGGDLTINGGATLDLGSNSINAALVTTAGASPIVTGPGTITASAGFLLNHTGNTAIAAVLAGSGGVLKAQSNTVSLSGANTYTGLTEVQDGVLSFDSIGNVGGGATALGKPANTGDGILRMGLTTASTGLTYTGAGHSSNRVIAMQGTTGGVTLSASGSGAVTFGAVTGFTPGAKTLTLGGASDPSINNTLGVIEDGVAIISVAKSNANTWEFNQANTYSGTTTVNDGILRINAGSNISAAAATVTAGTLDLRNGSQSIAALTMGNGPAGSTSAVLLNGGALNLGGNVTLTASSNAGLATIAGGTLNFGDATRTLTVNNSTATDTDLRISAAMVVGNGFGLTKAGSGRLEIATNFNLTGSTGTFAATGGTTDLTGSAYVIEGNLQVGLNSTGTLNYTSSTGSLSVGSGSANAVDIGVTSTGTAGGGTLNLAGLNQFTANVGSFRVGSLITGAGTGVSTTAVTLATNNTITASTAFILGDNGGLTAGVGAAVTLEFGSGMSTVTTPTMTLGGRKGPPDSTTGSRVTIATGGTLTLNNGLAKTDLFIGDNNIDTGTKTLTNVDLSGGSLVATLGNLIVARKSGSTSAGNSTATLTLGSSAANAVTADSVIIGNYVSGSASFANGTVNFGGGSFTVANDVTLASRGATSGLATGLLNLTGGTFSVGGNITTTNSASATATLTLEGATLDLTGGTINVDTFNARSGLLKNVAEIQNGDGSTAALLSKTTAGVLTMGNGNQYSGGTQVSGGILVAANTSGSATGSGAVTVDASGTLAGNGFIAPAADKNVTVNGTLQVGATGDGTGTAQQLTLTTSGSGLSSVNGVVAFDLFSGQDFIGENGASANDRLAVAGDSGFTMGSGATLRVTTSIPIDSSWVVGASWRLFDWSALTGGVTGTFSNVQPAGAPYFSDPINLPDLESIGLAWHFDAGVLTVVAPEPSRMLLLFFGLIGIWFRRRR